MQNDPLRDFLKFFRFHLSWFILSAGFFAVILISGIFLSTKYVVDTATEQVADTLPTASPEELELVATLEPSQAPTAPVAPQPEASIAPPPVFGTPSPAPKETPLPLPSLVPAAETNQYKTSTSDDSTYTVIEGDTLWNISEKIYGNGHLYTRLSQVNNLTNANVIQVGQILTVPQLSDQEKVAADQKGSITDQAWSDDNTVYAEYMIGRGDSLWKIAEKELGDPHRWREIYQANESVIGSNPDLIYPDVVLHIPTDAPPVSLTQQTSTVASSLLQ